MLRIKHNKRYIVAGVVFVLIILAVQWSIEKTKNEAIANMTVAEKKARFLELVVPAVNEVYDDLMEQYHQIKAEIAKNPNSAALAQLRKEYRAKDNKALLRALKPHPKSIAIAQAALESSWATSKFARKANNLFGVWSFDKDEPRIAAGEQRGEKTIWIKKYSSFKQSVAHYYKTIGRHQAYKDLRLTKMKTDDPYLLVKKLDKYSEKGHLYGQELAQVIKYNKFTRFDEN